MVREESKIDDFLVRRTMKGQLRDVKVVRREEIDSNHYLFLMIIKIEGKKPREGRTGGYNIRIG